MREIKFRGKKVGSYEWVYGLIYNYSYRGEVLTMIQDDAYAIKNGSRYGEEVERSTVGQYTGKKDCDGTDIYDGDIIEFDIKEWRGPDNIHIVSWDNEAAAWSWGGGCTSDMEYRKVIGNIHDNPELLTNA